MLVWPSQIRSSPQNLDLAIGSSVEEGVFGSLNGILTCDTLWFTGSSVGRPRNTAP